MHKVGIIIPFRNRWEQLETFYKHTIPYLGGTGIQYRIITVEQDDAKEFNRGMLCNIGFKEAVKLHCDYVVFHDVDMLPIDVDYSYSDTPIHLASDQLPFDTYFGGITLFPVESFKKINGFSNQYWGWGFEDDDLRRRCHIKKIDYGTPVPEVFIFNKPTAILNGIYSYISIKHDINTVRDFYIKLETRVGKYELDPTKTHDSFTLMCIPDLTVKVVINSFNRFYFSFFDKNNNYYDITSDIALSSSNIIEVEYKGKKKLMTLRVNNETAGEVQLKSRLKTKTDGTILLGCNENKQELYKGTVDTLEIFNDKTTLLKVSSDYVQNYSWVNKVNNEHVGKFKDILFDTYRYKTTIGNNVPHRRKSKVKRLEHEDQGFTDGIWKHSSTRWNQIRFTNNPSTHLTEGLSTCEYKVHSKSNKNKILHLKIGI